MTRIYAFLALILLVSMKQDNICELYIPIEEGTKLTYEDYNEKDKLQGSQTMEILKVLSTESKISVTSKIESFDKKGESVGENEFEYSCENGQFKVNMESFLPAETMAGMVLQGIACSAWLDENNP